MLNDNHQKIAVWTTLSLLSQCVLFSLKGRWFPLKLNQGIATFAMIFETMSFAVKFSASAS